MWETLCKLLGRDDLAQHPPTRQQTRVAGTTSDAGFLPSLADNLQTMGLKEATANKLTFSHKVLNRNQAPYDDGALSLVQILVIIGSFVLGVMVTTIVGVMGLRKTVQQQQQQQA